MPKLTNPWVGYIDRSYQQIKQKLIQRLTTKAPEITDHSESNPLIIILGMFAGLMEMLNYYVDNMAREAFLHTARLFPSVVRLVKLLDYRIKAAVPASTDLEFKVVDQSGNLAPLPDKLKIKAHTAVNTANNIQYLTTKDLVIESGDSIGVVSSSQITEVTEVLGQSNGTIDQQFSLGFSYSHASIRIVIEGEKWEEQHTLGLSQFDDNHFIVEVDENKEAFVVFGDGNNGRIPPSNKDIEAEYHTTLKEEGRVDQDTLTEIVDFNTIDTDNNLLLSSNDLELEVTNPQKSILGLGYENIPLIRRNAPKSLRTLDRAVTRRDYKDTALQNPGVGKAYVLFDCGKHIDIYVSPLGGGIADGDLLDSTWEFVEPRKMITTFVNTHAAGETRVKLNMDIWGTFRELQANINTDVKEALLEYGSFANQDINKSQRTSDIIALVDNLRRVDFLKLNSISTIPYARPLSHKKQLNWERETLEGSIEKVYYKLIWDGANFRIFKKGVFEGFLALNTIYDDNVIRFKIFASSYDPGDDWEFFTYPINKDLEIDDNTLPGILEGDLTLNIHEQRLEGGN